MNTMTTTLARLLKNEDGATMVEYGLIAALISIVAITSLKAIGPLVAAQFAAVLAALS
jgi:pilus assembly protein Flp/PilA